MKLVIIKSICIDLYNGWESFELEPLATRRRARKTHRKSGCRNKIVLDVNISPYTGRWRNDCALLNGIGAATQ